MDQANTVKLAMLLAKQRGWRELTIHCSNKTLMQKIKNKDTKDWHCTTIIENILDLCSLFDACSFQFVDQSKNVLATRIADFAVNLKYIVV